MRNAVGVHPGFPSADIMCFDDVWTDFDDYVIEEVQEAVVLSP